LGGREKEQTFLSLKIILYNCDGLDIIYDDVVTFESGTDKKEEVYEDW